MLRSTVRVFLVLLVAATVVQTAWATTAVERTEGDMVQESALILTGRCTHLQSEWVGRTLVTLATIQVTEALKGSPGATVTVALPGGVDANRRFPVAMTYPAAPQIQLQENVLLFLVPQDLVPGSYSIVGFSQGKLTLAETPQGKKMATQDLSALNLQGRTGTVRHGAAKTIVLDELRGRIRQASGLERENP